MTIFQIEFRDELPIGRKNSFLKGIIDHLRTEATTHSDELHTPDGHEIYRDKGEHVATQIIEAVKGITRS